MITSSRPRDMSELFPSEYKYTDGRQNPPDEDTTYL